MEMHSIIELAEMLGTGYRPSTEGIMMSCPNAPHTPLHKHAKDQTYSYGIKMAKFPEESVCNCFTCGMSGTVSSVFERLHGLGRITSDVCAFVRSCEVSDLGSFRDYLCQKRRVMVRQQAGGGSFNIQGFVFGCSVNRSGDDYFIGRGLSPMEISARSLGYDSKRQRATFPIFKGSRAVGCVGRTVVDQTPKYYKYTSEDSHVLYGESFLDPTYPAVHLVEGPMDAIVARRVVPNVLSLGGLILTQPQLERFLHFAQYVVLVLDGDPAGRQGTDRLGYILSKRIRTFVVSLPDGSDPAGLEPAQLLSLIAQKQVY